MGTLNRNTGKKSFMGSIVMAMGAAFGFSRPKPPEFHREGKHSRNYRTNISVNNPAGSKIRRAIERGNHGLVNKHGTIGHYFAESKRERWLLARGQVVIRLSTSV